jgi:serine/threonine-protein kinase
LGTVLVHVSASGRRAAYTLQLRAGEVAQFGRGVAECPVAIALDDPSVPRVAGEIAVAETYWHLSNLSRDQSLVVENPEGAGEYVRIAPRRLAAPIPFEFSRVVLATRTGTVGFQVYAPSHSYVDVDAVSSRPGMATVSPFSLNEAATYFLVLVALCEPRLRDISSVAVPTTPQVVDRLRQHPDHAQLTASAVSFHIEYLADAKLRIKHPQQQGRLDWKRDMLVSVSLRFGLVQEKHLALLPPYVAATTPAELSGVR